LVENGGSIRQTAVVKPTNLFILLALLAGATTTALALIADPTNAASYMLQATNTYGTNYTPAATFSVLPPNPAYVNVTNGLVLHLTFDGNYADSSGRGNNAAAVGTRAKPEVGGARARYALWYGCELADLSVGARTVYVGRPRASQHEGPPNLAAFG